MGTFKKGILGGFSGKVGTVIGATWRGLDVMRSLPKKSNSNPTLLQLDQRQKFKAMADFLSPLKGVFSTYYGSASGTSSRVNNAMSYHLKAAVSGLSPNFVIDYDKVVISKGEVIGSKDGAIAAPATGTLTVTWSDNSGQVLAEPDDLLLLVLYNVEKAQFMVLEGAATRDLETLDVSLPSDYTGDTLHAWMSFSSSNLKKAASSIYLGTVTAI